MEELEEMVDPAEVWVVMGDQEGPKGAMGEVEEMVE